MASLDYYARLVFIVTSLMKVVTCNMKEVMMFQMFCNDDFSHIGSLSTDCNKFIMCSQGMALPFSCPRGYIFNNFVMRCHLPSHAEKSRCSKVLLGNPKNTDHLVPYCPITKLKGGYTSIHKLGEGTKNWLAILAANMPFTCLHSPNSRVASYLSCAQYFDCSARPTTPNRYVNYVTECPYPQLFSPETGRCEPFQRVRCVGRTEPKAPCDYLQYQQLCEGPNCPPCPKRHPSCVGLSDGAHSVGKRSRVYVVCLAERTVNIGMCKANYVFNDARRTCVSRESLIPPVHTFSANQIAALFSGFSSVNKTDTENNKNGDQDSSSRGDMGIL